MHSVVVHDNVVVVHDNVVLYLHDLVIHNLSPANVCGVGCLEYVLL